MPHSSTPPIPLSSKLLPGRRFLRAGVALFVAVSCLSCTMLLQPTTPFDRWLVARRYGKILFQQNPDCDNCSDIFLVERSSGDVATVIIRFDGTIRLIE